MVEQGLIERSNSTAGLQIPEFRFNEQEPYRRLLFHFSPKSKVDQRGDGPLLPQSPLIAEDFIPKIRWGYDWEKIPQWVNELPDLARQSQSFFFLDEPFPNEWDAYPWYFEFCLAFVRKGVKEPTYVFALVTNESDEAYVVDREPMAKFQWRKEMLQWEGVLGYTRSVVTLKDYDGGYGLPEVIIPHPISSERLTYCGQVNIPDVPVQMRPKPYIIKRGRSCFDR